MGHIKSAFFLDFLLWAPLAVHQTSGRPGLGLREGLGQLELVGFARHSVIAFSCAFLGASVIPLIMDGLPTKGLATRLCQSRGVHTMQLESSSTQM